MQKLVCCILFIFLSLHTNAQKIRFTDTTNKWRVVDFTFDNNNVFWLSYAGDTVIKSQHYNIIGITYPLFTPLYVREDSNSEKVFIRISNSVENIPSDSDIVLYDYSLKINDTLNHFFAVHDSFSHVVTNIDSTLINGVWHKVWYLKCIKNTNSGNICNDYAVIEGIGSLDAPWFPVCPFTFENGWQMSCFINNTMHPLPSPAVPYVYGATSFTFDNVKSCTANVRTINNTPKQVLIVPSPANKSSKIIFPGTIQSGNLVIYNLMGQTIFEVAINNQTDYLIGDKISIPGLYFYKLLDNKNAQTFSGKFIYQ